MMKENENGQTDPVKAVFNTVVEFCQSGELEATKTHLLKIITDTDEWINRCPREEIADRVYTLCSLLQFVEKLEESLNTGKIEPDNDINN